MRRFYRQFLLFTLALGLLLYALRQVFGPAIVHPRTGLLFAYFAGLTLLTYGLMARLVARSQDNFVGAYFGGMTVRLLLSLSLLLTYLVRFGSHQNQDTLAFVGAFLFLYFSWAGFEIWAILSNLRPISGKQVTE